MPRVKRLKKASSECHVDSAVNFRQKWTYNFAGFLAAPLTCTTSYSGRSIALSMVREQGVDGKPL